MDLIKTNAQKAKEQVHTEIISLFKSLKKEHPNAKNLRIISTVAAKLGYSTCGIYQILKRYKII